MGDDERNVNCLAGMKCPKCGSLGPFRIITTCLATVSDDGIEETEEHEWDANAWCECKHCHECGTVGSFTERKGGEQ